MLLQYSVTKPSLALIGIKSRHEKCPHRVFPEFGNMFNQVFLEITIYCP